MSSAIILAAVILILIGAYAGYGSWLAKKWGIDARHPAPSHSQEDGRDYTAARTPMLFGHQLTSMTGAGAVSGPLQAAVFGWLPVLLWILIGGIFFGGVQNFISLLSSMRSKGKTIGTVMGETIGSRAKICFLLFGWLFLVLTVGAFLDITAGAFAGYGTDAAGNVVKNAGNGSAAMAAMMMLPLAASMGFLNRKKVNLFLLTVIGLALMGGCLIIALNFPVFAEKNMWVAILVVYLFFSSLLPVWLIQQPRDYLNSFLLYFIMILTTTGIFFTNPKLQLPMFTSWEVKGETLFPALFLTIACGILSGFQSLIASGSVSKQLSTEKHGKFVSYGSTLVACLFGIMVLLAVAGNQESLELSGNPAAVFSQAIGGLLTEMGFGAAGAEKANTLVLLCLTGIIFTSLDISARLGRYFWQELLKGGTGKISSVLSRPWVGAGITAAAAVLVLAGGYERIWPVFGVFGETAALCALLTGACWLKKEGKRKWMMYPSLIVMFLLCFSTIGFLMWKNVTALIKNPALLTTAGVQCVCLAAAAVFSIILAVDGLRTLLTGKTEESFREEPKEREEGTTC